MNKVLRLSVLVGSLVLLACPAARGQGPELGPAPKEAGGIIHADLPKADDAEESTNDPPRVWARAEAWLAWIKDGSFPPLVTVGAISQPRPGAVGQDGTMVRFGGHVDTQERLGGRLQCGGWLDGDELVGVELGYGFLASRAVAFELSSPGAPAIARPFFDVNAQRQDASLVTFPLLASGGISVRSGTSLNGAEASTLLTLIKSTDYPVRFLVGFRYVNLHDDLDINENVMVNPSSPVFAGERIGVRDLFDCSNYFYGGFLGLSGVYNIRNLELHAAAKCALGLSQECVGIAGWTRFDGPGVGQTDPAGLLALSTNSGSHVRNAFAVVPEADFDARYEITRHIVVSAGYSFLYWSSVARAGRQVNTNINPDLVPTSANYGQPAVIQQPQLSISSSDFWVHSVHLGLELRF